MEPDWAAPPDNTSTWGPFYRWKGNVWPRQFRLSVAVTREIEAPWRRGFGITLKWGHRDALPFAYAIGIWKKGSPPPSEARQTNFEDVIERARYLDTLRPPDMDIRDLREDVGDGERHADPGLVEDHGTA